ncbi:flippase [Duncaniella muris]|uniref:flippase n=1 Tax=Duncaniella muris TaxID=2094150 RepID=UPI0026764ED9|nr:flippase [Duncaniella muris]
MSSIKTNIILNGLNTITGIVFPVITFPYAARVLLPEGIGTVNFLNSIILYIILFSTLGIPAYAVREVAKHRDNKSLRDKFVVEILSLSLMLCMCAYVAVFLMERFIPQIHSNQTLFYILSLSIFFTSIGSEWFYQGIEDFKFITIRAIAIRTLAALSLFAFVRSSSDLIAYGFVMVGTTVGNYIANFIHLRKYISVKDIEFKDLQIISHLRPALKIFALYLITSLYLLLNSVMLGFISGDEAVGFFTAGNKISNICLTLITSLGTVLLPRCSHLIKSGDMESFSSVINKSLNLTMTLALPITVGLMLLAGPITMIFCGPEFSESIPVLYISAPIIVFISLTNLMGIQILYPMDKVKLLIIGASGGAIMNICLNIILMPPLGAKGAAIATFAAELSILVIQIVLGRLYYPFKISELIKWKVITATTVMGIAIYLSQTFPMSDLGRLIIGFSVGITVYGVTLWILKDQMLFGIIDLIKSKISGH